MRIVGVDADSKKLAVVMFENDQLESWHFLESKNKETQERIFDLYFHFEAFIKTKKPDIVFIEQSIYVKNFVTSKAITEVIGNCKLLCKLHKVPFEMVGNTTWKKYVVGNGKATKEEIKTFIDKKYPQLKDESQDIADATCIALYGILEKGEK